MDLDGSLQASEHWLKTTPSLLNRFLGCLLGGAVGDALGAPFEGMPADAIFREFGGARNIVANPPVEELCYTDDTQMTIALAETLLERGRVEQDALGHAFLENYDPNRGYGPGARQILETVARGGDWNTLADTIFPGGSYGNGAATRVAPVALLFNADLDRVVAEARASSLPTHRHALGIEGAQLIALAVALALRRTAFDSAVFFETLLSYCETDEFRRQITEARRLKLTDAVAFLGSTLEAHRSVVTAIACFAGDVDSYGSAVGRAIGLGGDTDTLAAMTGSISGAHLGLDAIPPHLLQRLENGEKGRDYLIDLGHRLHDRQLQVHE